jgi:microcin C transport system permease protein
MTKISVLSLWHGLCFVGCSNRISLRTNCERTKKYRGHNLMFLYIAKRFLMMGPTLVGVVTLTFLVTQFLPGGPVEHLLAQMDGEGFKSGGESVGLRSGFTYSGRVGISNSQVEKLNSQFGYDKPLLDRYFAMLKNYFKFELGESYYHQRRVSGLLMDKLGITIALGTWTFILTYLISVPLGIAKAVRHGSKFDMVTSFLVLTGYAMPGFILGVLLILLFGGGSFLDIFPLRGLTSDGWSEMGPVDKVLDYLWHLTLPLAASVVSLFAVKTLLTKNTFLDEIRKQYVLTARAKGLSEREVLWNHVLRNSLLPLITGFPGTFISSFLAGSLLIETLFSIDGIGRLSFDAINNRDYPVVLGALFVFTLVGMAIKLLADVAYAIVDPRIKFSSQNS